MMGGGVPPPLLSGPASDRGGHILELPGECIEYLLLDRGKFRRPARSKNLICRYCYILQIESLNVDIPGLRYIQCLTRTSV